LITHAFDQRNVTQDPNALAGKDELNWNLNHVYSNETTDNLLKSSVDELSSTFPGTDYPINQTLSSAATSAITITSSTLNKNVIDSSLDESAQSTDKRLLVWGLMISYLRDVLTLNLESDTHALNTCLNASSLARTRIIFDSGATHHVLNDNPILFNVRAVTGHPGVKLGNGSVMRTKCLADTPLLEDVLIVPDILIGLISTSQLFS